MSDVDVLVVGSGLAGLAAALTAREAGAERVLIAEADRVVGGSSRLSGGVVMGGGSQVQRAAGIHDDPDALFHDYLQLNQWDLDVGIVRRFAATAGETVDWLTSHGVRFFDQLIYGGDEREPRSHCVDGGGQAIVDALSYAAAQAGIDVALGQRVDRLLVDDAGAVYGVAVGPDEITATAVVLATGGFGANRELLEEHYPSACHGDATWYIGTEHAQGDAFTLGAQVEAQVTGTDRGLRTLTPDFGKVNEAFLPGWAVLVDRDGHRFCDETAPYGILDGLMRARGDRAFVIFDDAALRPPAELSDRYRHAYKQVWPNHPPFRTKNYNAEIVDEMVRQERVHVAETLEELSARSGLPADALAGAVARYNADAANGEDRDFRKDVRFLLPVTTPPFYAAEIVPAVVALTGCGLRIDDAAQVVARDGRAIPGLYAAGECTGGVIGTRYMGSGNGLASAGTVGRIAGRSAGILAGR